MQNVGKKFEQDFIKSAPESIGVLRIPDAAQSFYRSSNLRFSRKNPFDFILWNPNTLTLYALELKTVNGKSISFERTKEEHGEIHYHQIVGLENFDNIGECVCGFIIEFRELEITIFLPITEFLKMQSQIQKKSFNYNDLANSDIDYIVIPQKKLKTHYRYDIEHFLEETALHKCGMEVNQNEV